MRYMMLIYGREDDSATPEQVQAVARRHGALMSEAAARGVFQAADPLAPVATATTVRLEGDGHVLLTDGPFAETKEQLAGYYILDCENLDDAIEWAARIPTMCKGGDGCVEIRPLPGIPARPPGEASSHATAGPA